MVLDDDDDDEEVGIVLVFCLDDVDDVVDSDGEVEDLVVPLALLVGVVILGDRVDRVVGVETIVGNGDCGIVVAIFVGFDCCKPLSFEEFEWISEFSAVVVEVVVDPGEIDKERVE
jgi:hypothetical protein